MSVCIQWTAEWEHLLPLPPSPHLIQAYTSQFLSLVMFALMMSEDSISKLPRRQAIIKAMGKLPGELTE